MSFSIDKILQFINTYYLDPIRGDEGYNPVNTYYLGSGTGHLHIWGFQASRKA